MQTVAKEIRAPADPAGLEMPVEEMTTERLTTVFRTEGVVIVRGLLGDARKGELRQALCAVISAQYRHATGHDPDPDADLDTLYNALCAIDRRLGSLVYKAAREVPAFYALLLHPWIQDVVKTLLATDTLHIPYEKASFRIDRPHEPRFKPQWRQDYTCHQMSDPTVTVWTPLTPVTEDMGPLCVIPRSHDRLLPIRLAPRRDDHGRPMAGKSATLADADSRELDRRAVAICLEPGDVAFFHQLLLHRSGRNTSDRSRWSMMPRYGRMLDPDMVARGWTIESATDFAVLRNRHPRAVVTEE